MERDTVYKAVRRSGNGCYKSLVLGDSETASVNYRIGRISVSRLRLADAGYYLFAFESLKAATDFLCNGGVLDYNASAILECVGYRRVDPMPPPKSAYFLSRYGWLVDGYDDPADGVRMYRGIKPVREVQLSEIDITDLIVINRKDRSNG